MTGAADEATPRRERRRPLWLAAVAVFVLLASQLGEVRANPQEAGGKDEDLLLASQLGEVRANPQEAGGRDEDPLLASQLGEVRAPGQEAGAAKDEAGERAVVTTIEDDAPRPVRLDIPAINLSAPVIPLGLNPDRTLEVPKDYGDTGWWTDGPEPGERGAAVIAGHFDSTTGPAVFYRLDDLDPGDEVRVRRGDGTSVGFVVTHQEQFPKERFPTARVYTRTGRPALRLVTCSGDFDEDTGHYEDNTVVYLRKSLPPNS